MFISPRISEDYLTGKPYFHFKLHCHHVNWGSSEHTIAETLALWLLTGGKKHFGLRVKGDLIKVGALRLNLQ